MPYDPRPVSAGGNAGIDDRFSRNAPTGKFRVVWVDTFDGDDGVLGDFDTFDLAKEAADKNGGEMSKSHVYNDQGKHVYEAGTF
jgi:hypothetical protein